MDNAYQKVKRLSAGSIFRLNMANYLRTQDGVLPLSTWVSRADSVSIDPFWDEYPSDAVNVLSYELSN